MVRSATWRAHWRLSYYRTWRPEMPRRVVGISGLHRASVSRCQLPNARCPVCATAAHSPHCRFACPARLERSVPLTQPTAPVAAATIHLMERRKIAIVTRGGQPSARVPTARALRQPSPPPLPAVVERPRPVPVLARLGRLRPPCRRLKGARRPLPLVLTRLSPLLPSLRRQAASARA
jgi:hypothetical protein